MHVTLKQRSLVLTASRDEHALQGRFIYNLLVLSLLIIASDTLAAAGLKYGLKVCCGAGGQGKYNYNNKARCGMSGASACADPGNYLIWDGIHLTEAAYRSIADGWLKGPYCNPPIQH